MNKYMKKPIVVDAVKVLGSWEFDEDASWAVDAAGEGKIRFWKSEFDVHGKAGVTSGKYGDYLVREANGEMIACSSDIFENSYEETRGFLNEKEALDDYGRATDKNKASDLISAPLNEKGEW